MKLHHRPSAWLPLLAVFALLATTPLAQAQSASPPAASMAPDSSASAAPSNEPVGQQGRQWLRAQAAREQASSQRQTLSGPAMKAVNDRYVRSFTTAIEPTSLHNRDPIKSN